MNAIKTRPAQSFLTKGRMLHHEVIYEFTLASDNEKWEVITARFPPVVIPAHAEIQVLFSRISLDTCPRFREGMLSNRWYDGTNYSPGC